VKRTSLTKHTGLILCLGLYLLAIIALVLSQPPLLIVLLSLLLLCSSFWQTFVSTDRIIDIVMLDESQLLLKTRKGRQIPAEIHAYYFSALGQVVYCQRVTGRAASCLERQTFFRADLLPVYSDLTVWLRQQRCLYLAQLSHLTQQDSCQQFYFSGDRIVSRASGSRSGTSMLK
jgi:hypothetical protein